MRYKAAAITALVVMAGGVFGACGSDDDKGSDGGDSKKPLNVAFVHYTINDYTSILAAGANEVAKKTGGSVKTFNANFDPTTQGKQCSDAITSGRYNAIILGSVTSSSSTACIRQAKAADIPVVAIDTSVGKDPTAIEPSVDGVVAQVVFGMKTNAAGVAELTRKACEGKDPCNAIVEIANPADELTALALKAIKDGDAGDNVKVVGTFASSYDPANVTKNLPDLLTAHPETNVVVAIADNTAVAAVPIVKESGKDILVTANGGSRAGVAAIKAGTVFGSLGLWPHQAGVIAGQAALDAVNGDPIEQPGVDQFKIDTPEMLYRDNIDEFTPEWGAQ